MSTHHHQGGILSDGLLIFSYRHPGWMMIVINKAAQLEIRHKNTPPFPPVGLTHILSLCVRETSGPRSLWEGDAGVCVRYRQHQQLQHCGC